MKISIILPTFFRPEQVRRHTLRLLETVGDLDVEIIAVVEQDDRAMTTLADLPVQLSYHADWRGSMANWNIGAALATGDLFVLGADDIWWHDRWLHNALDQMARAGTCYVGLNDLLLAGPDQNIAHWAITRQGIVEYCGGCLMPPPYVTTWGDNEITERIRRAGQFTYCAEAIVEHRHHGNRKARMDRGYRMVTRHFYQDQATFERRQAAGFPDDFDPVVRPCTTR